MVTEPAHHICGVAHEQVLVKRIEVESFCRKPEVVPHHHAILVAQLIKSLRGACSCPVADHVESCILVEDEIRLQMLSGNVLHHVVHSPVSSAAEYPDTVDLDHKIRAHAVVRNDIEVFDVYAVSKGRNMESSKCIAEHPVIENFAEAVVRYRIMLYPYSLRRWSVDRKLV